MAKRLDEQGREYGPHEFYDKNGRMIPCATYAESEQAWLEHDRRIGAQRWIGPLETDTVPA